MALPTKEELGFDPDALRDKYRAERDKRLRDDANEQYREIKDEYVDFLADPYIADPISRAPLTRRSRNRHYWWGLRWFNRRS